MSKPATIIVSPRDRYSGVEDCIASIYQHTPTELFDLIILDLGYPKSILKRIEDFIADKDNARIVDYGRIIPMAAMDRIRQNLHTDYAVFLDNDSRTTPGWLEPVLQTAMEQKAAVVYPVTLERSGVDAGADIRNHLFTTELRVVDVEHEPYLIEHKTYRRALPDDLPSEPTESQAFELHCVMFETATLKAIEIPHMTIREHLDIGMQLKSLGRKILVEPKSQIIFDNLGTRANLDDLKYFNLRWNSRITEHSSRLFEQRWGYKFYSEQSIYNWAIRRRLFLLMRWLGMPIKLANLCDRIFFALRRRLFPIWDPLDNPNEKAESLYARLEEGVPNQLSHNTV